MKYIKPKIAKNEILICIENNKETPEKAVDLICKYIDGLLRDAKNQISRMETQRHIEELRNIKL